MRKNSIAKQVKYFYELMNLEVVEKSNGGNSYKIIQNWYSISTALYKLNEYDFVGKSIEDIFELGASFQSSSNTIAILSHEYANFVNKFNIVKAKCEAIIDSSNIEDDVYDLYVKLPDELNDLNSLSSIIKNLDLSFNKCPVLSNNIGNVSFKRVEEGSSWIVLGIAAAVSTAKVLEWIANFIKSCNEIRIQNRTIKNLDLDNILKEMEIDEKLQKQYKNKVITSQEEKIKKMCLEHFNQIEFDDKKITSEDEARIVHSMSTLMELMDNGVELYPSNNTSQEIKLLFPKQEELKALEDTRKLLQNKDEK